MNKFSSGERNDKMERIDNTGDDEHLFKILIIGDIGTGKTAFIKRYVHGIFSPHYKSTIGVDFALKVIKLDDGTVVRLQLWDIAGQERFGNMTRIYYKESVAAFLLYDVTRQTTFDAVKRWKLDLDSKVSWPGEESVKIPVVLLANKTDLIMNSGDDETVEKWKETQQDLDKFCNDHGFVGWFGISAKDDTNSIEKSVNFLVEKVMENMATYSGGGVGIRGNTNNISIKPQQDHLVETVTNCTC